MDQPKPAQTVGDLRTLVVRRAGAGRRVALLSADPALKAALEANQCTVLADPESYEALAGFRADVVVAFDGFLREGGEALRAVGLAAPKAELVLSFANAASATAALRALAGQSQLPASAEREVEALLAEVGYVVQHRDLVVSSAQPSGLSADTEAALRQLFEQLNPSAAADRVLWTARPGAPLPHAARVPGLVSVVVSGGADARALGGTVASLARQRARPLELVVAAALDPLALEAVVAPLRGASTLTLVTVPGAPADWAAQANLALRQATGQWIAFAGAGDLFEPGHLERLTATLRDATAAWVVGAPRALAGQPFRLPTWLEGGWVDRAGWLVDRARLGAFALEFPEGSELAEAMLFTRLGLVFSPALAPDVGQVDTPRAPQPRLAGVLGVLRGRPLRALVTLEVLAERGGLTEALAERLDSLKPGVGQQLARAVRWWQQRPSGDEPR